MAGSGGGTLLSLATKQRLLVRLGRGSQPCARRAPLQLPQLPLPPLISP